MLILYQNSVLILQFLIGCMWEGMYREAVMWLRLCSINTVAQVDESGPFCVVYMWCTYLYQACEVCCKIVWGTEFGDFLLKCWTLILKLQLWTFVFKVPPCLKACSYVGFSITCICPMLSHVVRNSHSLSSFLKMCCHLCWSVHIIF